MTRSLGQFYTFWKFTFLQDDDDDDDDDDATFENLKGCKLQLSWVGVDLDSPLATTLYHMYGVIDWIYYFCM